MRTRSERRHNDWKHIHRKLFIVRHTWSFFDEDWKKDWKMFKEIHRWSKQKVHCSCRMCSAKTSKDGWSPSSKRQIESAMSSFQEVN